MTDLMWLYILMENTFLVVFIYFILPLCNRRTEPKPYRDYGQDRHQLLLRLLNRMERSCQASDRNVGRSLEEFLSNWFHRGRRQVPQPPIKLRIDNTAKTNNSVPQLVTCPSIASESSDSFDDKDGGMLSSMPTTGYRGFENFDDDFQLDLYKEDVQEFLAGAFFGKTYEDLNDDWETNEFHKVMSLFVQRTKTTFLLPGKGPAYRPLRLSLEDVNPIPRPLLVYFLVAVLKQIANLILRCCGFKRFVTKTSLVYWYRPASSCDGAQSKHTPFLFFHGIAPAGFTVYLPMVLFGLAHDRSTFIFENPTISCMLGFQALTEEETIIGVQEAVNLHLSSDEGICLCGHSFGSCQLTWLLHSPLQTRIKQFILLDPISILLSEPDVLASFLYSNPCGNQHTQASWQEQLWEWLVRCEMRLMISSEVFTEYYLRRHFSWYNSELWLEDLPLHVQVLVCLAQRDEITCTSKVMDEIRLYNTQRHQDSHQRPKIKVIFWKNVGHGYCIVSSKAWLSIKAAMLEQEKLIFTDDNAKVVS